MTQDLWPERLKIYDAVIAQNPNFERKGKTVPYTSVNGHMFSQLNKAAEIGLRLPKEQREQFLEKHQTTLFISYGAVMKEYVRVPESLLQDMDLLASYFNDSYEYVKSLKPK